MHLRIAAGRRTHLLQAFCLIVSLLFGGLIRADYVWVGGNTGVGNDDSWNNGANWSGTPGGNPPDGASNQQVRIEDALGATATVGNTVTASAGTNLFVSDNPTNFGTLIVDGGTLNITAGGFSVGGNGNTGGHGTLILSNGGTITLSAGSFNMGHVSNASASFQSQDDGNFFLNGGLFNIAGAGLSAGVALRGNGTLTQNDGTFQMNAGSLVIGRSGGQGTYTMNGGTLILGQTTDSGAQLFVANSSSGIASSGRLTLAANSNAFVRTGGLTIASAGTATVTVNSGSISAGSILVSSASTSSGTLIINGGKVNSTGSFNISDTTGAIGNVIVGDGGTGAATLSTNGGSAGTLYISRNTSFATLTVNSGGTIVMGSNGTLNIVNNSNSTGTFIQNGGLVILNRINLNNNGGTSNFQLNGGEMIINGTISFSNGSPVATQSGGTLTANALVASMNFNGGTLSPGTTTAAGGGAFFGTTSFSAGNVQSPRFKSNYHIHVNVGDNLTNDPLTTNRDLVQVTNGSATFDAGSFIDVDWSGGDLPAVGTLYDVLTTTLGVFITNHSDLSIVSHDPTLQFDYQLVNSNNTLELIVTVPEPASMAVVGIGAIALLGRRRRRTKPMQRFRAPG
jgi:hypothetical protein